MRSFAFVTVLLHDLVPSLMGRMKITIFVKIGPAVTEERGCAVADGDMDPITGESFIDAIVARGKEGQKGANEPLRVSEVVLSVLPFETCAVTCGRLEVEAGGRKPEAWRISRSMPRS